ncbi:MAG: MarR family transcriptional regulator, partial [Pseudomonadota bacterium]
MDLTPAMQDFILHWGEMGTRWGTNRSVAQIHALLHLTPDPLPAEEIAESLNMARSNVSSGLKELQGWKLIKVSRTLGDRRDHFIGIAEMVDIVQNVVDGRREREYAPTVQAVRATLAAS